MNLNEGKILFVFVVVIFTGRTVAATVLVLFHANAQNGLLTELNSFFLNKYLVTVLNSEDKEESNIN